MNWPDLTEDVRLELALLHQLLDESAELRALARRDCSTQTDRLAAGALLQSFYNGVENVFVCITTWIDGGWPEGDNRRQSLLDSMAQATPNRSAVIDEELHDELQRMMSFRESFRYAHFFLLDWEHARPLAVDCQKALAMLETQLDAFLSEASGQPVVMAAEDDELPAYWTEPKKPREIHGAKFLTATSLAALVVGAALGTVVTAALRPRRKPQTVQANVVADFLDRAKFTDPAGRPGKMPLPAEKYSFRVTTGKIAEKTDEKFTGRMVSTVESRAGLPRLALTFDRGNCVSIEATDEGGNIEMGCFDNRRLLRYTVCGADGRPRRTFHLNHAGQTFAAIDRSTYTDFQTYDARDGWMYSFYHNGTKMAEVFATDDGLIRMAGVRNQGAMFTSVEFDDAGYPKKEYPHREPDNRGRPRQTKNPQGTRPAE